MKHPKSGLGIQILFRMTFILINDIYRDSFELILFLVLSRPIVLPLLVIPYCLHTGSDDEKVAAEKKDVAAISQQVPTCGAVVKAAEKDVFSQEEEGAGNGGKSTFVEPDTYPREVLVPYGLMICSLYKVYS